MDTSYKTSTQSIITAVFFHYIGYLAILILDSVDYIKKVRIVYGSNFFFDVLCFSNRKRKTLKGSIFEDHDLESPDVVQPKALESGILQNALTFLPP